MAGATTIRFGKAKIEIRGFEELFNRLSKVDDNARRGAVDAFRAATTRVLAKSQANVPVEDGNLKASGRKSKPRINKRTLRVTASVNYGGPRLARLAPDEPPLYGIFVHENPSGRGYKFLERSMLADKRNVMSDLANRIAHRVERGGK